MPPFPDWVPRAVVDGYAEDGIVSLFAWQAHILSDPSLIRPNFHNLLYTAPTSAGKSLVADILALHTVLSTQKKAIFILPYVSMGREKFTRLQKIWRKVDLRVRSYVGVNTSPLDSWDAVVSTIEKANSLINKLIEEEDITKLGVVIIDEFHMVFDSNRGHLIENIVAKLNLIASRSDERLQLIAMSATIENILELSSWLNAHQYTSTFRPVSLKETILIGAEICDIHSLRPLRHLPPSYIYPDDSSHLIG
ncbi:hypothetical protein AB6A40_010854 [Gnathostoma spinigerum]|uniref:Helicase ATP-binding domain-containing protein n=1 Tax=Gnathostoma spinigerum TaxID=75299 RepID=A0ABD6EXG1_9BILA